ncbi:MAG: serine hydrolase [Gammaproteobacteria bacterium]|nr:serine hydrolase [Gammaproteobacteria bacterium]
MSNTSTTHLKKALVVLLVLIAGAVVWQYENLTRLYRVVTLFKADQIVANFARMPDIMLSEKIVRHSTPQPWPVKLRPPPATYQWRGVEHSIAQFLDETVTTSLLVLNDGVIVHEEYRLGTARNDLRISWSMAKSYLSAMFGIAIDTGAIGSIDEPINKYVPELIGTAYDGVPMRHVLNMASGVEFDEDYLAFGSDINKMGRVLALGGSMDEFAASLQQRARPPGTRRSYVSIDTHVLSMALRKATGQSLQEYFSIHLWSPMRTAGDAWYLTDGQGAAFALGGLNMRTRDYARFGEMFRNHGQWGDRQVVPASWVRASTQPSAPPPVSETDPFGYGYQWWVPPRSDGDFFAGGIYGQFIYVSPATATVVVKTSAHRGFRNDGNAGATIKAQTIEMMRALAQHYAVTASVVN